MTTSAQRPTDGATSAATVQDAERGGLPARDRGGRTGTGGAGGRDRTADLPLTRRLLCQLSYAGRLAGAGPVYQSVYRLEPRAP